MSGPRAGSQKGQPSETWLFTASQTHEFFNCCQQRHYYNKKKSELGIVLREHRLGQHSLHDQRKKQCTKLLRSCQCCPNLITLSYFDEDFFVQGRQWPPEPPEQQYKTSGVLVHELSMHLRAFQQFMNFGACWTFTFDPRVPKRIAEVAIGTSVLLSSGI